MFNKILITLHGSEPQETVNSMINITKHRQASISVLHVLETGLTHYGHVDTLASSVSKDQFVSYIHNMAEEQKEKAFELFTRAAEDLNLECNFKTAQGKPGPEILKEVQAGQYDLLLIGRKEYVKIGNTSSKTREYLVNKITCSLFMFN